MSSNPYEHLDEDERDDMADRVMDAYNRMAGALDVIREVVEAAGDYDAEAFLVDNLASLIEGDGSTRVSVESLHRRILGEE